jgi:hypothetical protein
MHIFAPIRRSSNTAEATTPPCEGWARAFVRSEFRSVGRVVFPRAVWLSAKILQQKMSSSQIDSVIDQPGPSFTRNALARACAATSTSAHKLSSGDLETFCAAAWIACDRFAHSEDMSAIFVGDRCEVAARLRLAKGIRGEREAGYRAPRFLCLLMASLHLFPRHDLPANPEMLFRKPRMRQCVV